RVQMLEAEARPAVVGLHVKDLEDLLVILTSLDQRAEHAEEREARDAEVVRPVRPQDCFVHDRFADVEEDRTDRHGDQSVSSAQRSAASSSTSVAGSLT